MMLRPWMRLIFSVSLAFAWRENNACETDCVRLRQQVQLPAGCSVASKRAHSHPFQIDLFLPFNAEYQRFFQ